MRLISSRESFARFGVPYGPDAIAYAASTSRHDLEPPPDFESHVISSAAVRSPSPLAGLNGESSTLPGAHPAPHDSSSTENIQKAPRQNAESIEDADYDVEHRLGVVRSSPNQLHDAEPLPSVAVPLTISAIQQVPPKVTTSVPPPSAFGTLPTFTPVRSESRASSMTSAMSYTTAEEYMYESATSGTRTPESPSTPRRTSFNSYENTDTTIS